MNIHVLRRNSLLIPRGLYTDWMGNALSDSDANTLIAEGTAILTNIGNPGLSPALSAPQKLNTNIKGVAGVGGGKLYDETGAELTLGGRFAKLAVVGVGDSLMGLGDGVQAGGSANVRGPTSQSIMAWALSQIAKNTAYEIVANRGVSNKTIDLVISEQLASALADNADILWVHAGVNNLNATLDVTLPTVAEIVSRMDYLLSIAANVPLVVLDAITPLAEGSISGAYARRADIPLINAGYKALAAKHKNVMFNDIYTPLALDATSGLAKENMTVAADKIHLSSYGAFTAGVASAINLLAAGFSFRRPSRLASSIIIPRLNTTGGTKTPGTGTINGDVATGYEINIVNNQTGVVITASVDPVNNKQRIRIQNGNAAASLTRFQFSSAVTYAIGLAGGTNVRAGINIDLISQTGLYRHDLDFFQNPSGSQVAFTSLQKGNGENGANGTSLPTYPPGPYSLRLIANGTLTATTTSAQMSLNIEVAPGGDVTLDISDLTLETTTAYG